MSRSGHERFRHLHAVPSSPDPERGAEAAMSDYAAAVQSSLRLKLRDNVVVFVARVVLRLASPKFRTLLDSLLEAGQREALKSPYDQPDDDERVEDLREALHDIALRCATVSPGVPGYELAREVGDIAVSARTKVDW